MKTTKQQQLYILSLGIFIPFTRVAVKRRKRKKNQQLITIVSPLSRPFALNLIRRRAEKRSFLFFLQILQKVICIFFFAVQFAKKSFLFDQISTLVNLCNAKKMFFFFYDGKFAFVSVFFFSNKVKEFSNEKISEATNKKERHSIRNSKRQEKISNVAQN